MPVYILCEPKTIGPNTELPVGMLIHSDKQVAGALLCNGQEYDPAAYPDLDLVLRQPYRRRRRRFGFGRLRFGPRVEFGPVIEYPYGRHRVPDLRGKANL